MNKNTIAGIFLWLLGAVFVVIAALLMRVERWFLVRRLKKDLIYRENTAEGFSKYKSILDVNEI
jgi:hypothetical protein